MTDAYVCSPDTVEHYYAGVYCETVPAQTIAIYAVKVESNLDRRYIK